MCVGTCVSFSWMIPDFDNPNQNSKQEQNCQGLVCHIQMLFSVQNLDFFAHPLQTHRESSQKEIFSKSRSLHLEILEAVFLRKFLDFHLNQRFQGCRVFCTTKLIFFTFLQLLSRAQSWSCENDQKCIFGFRSEPNYTTQTGMVRNFAPVLD